MAAPHSLPHVSSRAEIVAALSQFPDSAEYQRLFKLVRSYPGGPGVKIGSGTFGKVYELLPNGEAGEAYVRAQLGLRADQAVPPLIVKEMFNLGDLFRAEQAGREGRAVGADKHPGIATNIATFIERDGDNVPMCVRFVLPRATGMGDDGLPEDYGGGSKGDFWRIVYVLASKSSTLSENACKAVALQVLSAVRHLHSHGFMHRDLKAENLLCFGSKRFRGEDVPIIAIADLGTLKFVPEDARMLPVASAAPPAAAPPPPAAAARSHTVGIGANPKYVGTHQYLAPELLEVLGESRRGHVVKPGAHFDAATNKVLSEYSAAVDVYSVGVLMFYVLSGGFLPYAREEGGALVMCASKDDKHVTEEVKVEAWKQLKEEVNNKNVRWVYMGRREGKYNDRTGRPPPPATTAYSP